MNKVKVILYISIGYMVILIANMIANSNELCAIVYTGFLPITIYGFMCAGVVPVLR